MSESSPEKQAPVTGIWVNEDGSVTDSRAPKNADPTCFDQTHIDAGWHNESRCAAPENSEAGDRD